MPLKHTQEALHFIREINLTSRIREPEFKRVAEALVRSIKRHFDRDAEKLAVKAVTSE